MAESSRKRLPKQTNFRPFQLNEAVRSSIQRPPLGYVLNSHLVRRTYSFKEELKTYIPLLRSLEDHPSLNQCFAVVEVYSLQMWKNFH